MRWGGGGALGDSRHWKKLSCPNQIEKYFLVCYKISQTNFGIENSTYSGSLNATFCSKYADFWHLKPYFLEFKMPKFIYEMDPSSVWVKTGKNLNV